MIEQATFTPSEAARITGVNVALQRDWRRRGFLPKEAGHARFSPFQLSEIMGMGALAARGIGPAQTKPVSRIIAAGILRGALENKEAWDGNWDELARLKLQFLPEWAGDHPGVLEPARMRWLSDGLITGEGVLEGEIKRAFYWWADETIGLYASMMQPLEEIDRRDVRFSGAVISLDLESLGCILLERAKVKLARFELATPFLEPIRLAS